MNLVKVEERIGENNSLDFGLIFNKSIELFKKVWIQGFVTLLLTFVCMLCCYLLFYIPLMGGILVDYGIFQNEEPGVISILTMLLLYPIWIISIGAVVLALNASFLRICQQHDLGLRGNEDYFYYFKNGNFKKALVMAFYTFIIAVLGMMACGIGLFYVIVPLSLIPAFFAFNEDMKPIDMVKASFTLGNKNWGIIFGLLLVMGLLAQLGILLCGIGMLFTAMLAKVPIYYMYKDGVGFSDSDEDMYLIK